MDLSNHAWMFRRFLILLTVLSLLLCLAAMTLWVRSCIGFSYAVWSRESHEAHFASGDGELVIAWGTVAPHDRGYPPPGWSGSFWPFGSRKVGFLSSIDEGATFGFLYNHRETKAGAVTRSWHLLILPYWFPACCFAALPISKGIRFVRRAR
jgi:hypothetical protein